MPRDTREAGPDGVTRSPDEQKRINAVLAAVFASAAGRAALDYLRSISIERVCGPHATDGEIRHLEGQRFLLGVISQRIAAHHREESRATSRPARTARASGASDPSAAA